MKPLDQILSEISAITRYSADKDILSEIFPEDEKNKMGYAEEIIRKLYEARAQHNIQRITDLLLVADADGMDSRYTEVFCLLLIENWHDSQEDIAFSLMEIADPQSVDCLYQAAVSIPEYDEFRSLAKKCIMALGAIKTNEARQRLESLSNHDDEIISQYTLKTISFYYE